MWKCSFHISMLEKYANIPHMHIYDLFNIKNLICMTLTVINFVEM